MSTFFLTYIISILSYAMAMAQSIILLILLLHLPVSWIQSPLNWRIFFLQLFYNLVDAGLYKNRADKIVTIIAYFGKEW